MDEGLSVDCRVEAKWQNGKKWYLSRIIAENSDGSYGVLYPDGSLIDSVPAAQVRLAKRNVKKTSSSNLPGSVMVKGTAANVTALKKNNQTFRKLVVDVPMREVPDNPIVMARQHLTQLKHLVSNQLECVQYVAKFLTHVVQWALSFDGDNERIGCLTGELHAFGSREYKMALPNSDADFVCILPESIYNANLSKKVVLQRALWAIKKDGLCSAVKDTIQYKGTVGLRFATLRVA